MLVKKKEQDSITMKKVTIVLLFLLGVLLNGCVTNTEDYPVEPVSDPIPTPSTFNDVLLYMEDYSAEKRLTGMWAVLDYPDKADIAIPLLIQNLYYPTAPDIRERAAEILGMLGEKSVSAVPDLISVAKSDTSINVRVEVAVALGNVGDKEAVPTLVNNLYKNHNRLGVASARSIAKITGLGFPEANSQGYTLTANGVPSIVVIAQTWWESEGQYQDWDN